MSEDNLKTTRAHKLYAVGIMTSVIFVFVCLVAFMSATYVVAKGFMMSERRLDQGCIEYCDGFGEYTDENGCVCTGSSNASE